MKYSWTNLRPHAMFVLAKVNYLTELTAVSHGHTVKKQTEFRRRYWM